MRGLRTNAVLVMGLAAVLLSSCPRMRAQASALPSAQGAGSEESPTGKGRKLIDQMISALGGDAWLNRQDWIYSGRVATFYKGQPHEGAPQFEELRAWWKSGWRRRACWGPTKDRTWWSGGWRTR